MSEIRVKEGESLESALKRFKRELPEGWYDPGSQEKRALRKPQPEAEAEV